MRTVSESLAKLSASMAELSQRAKDAEDHIAAVWGARSLHGLRAAAMRLGRR